MDQIKNNEIVEQEETTVSDEISVSPEMLAEMNAQKDQELFGNHVKKIGGCAVVIVEDVIVSLEMPINYPQLLSAIIKQKYDSDQAEAITANFLTARTQNIPETKALEYTTEYEAYQAWRNKAKAVAKEVMGIES